MCLDQPQDERVFLGQCTVQYVHVSQSRGGGVLWDICVLDQCVVVQPKAVAKDFLSVWKWDYAFL